MGGGIGWVEMRGGLGLGIGESVGENGARMSPLWFSAVPFVEWNGGVCSCADFMYIFFNLEME